MHSLKMLVLNVAHLKAGRGKSGWSRRCRLETGTIFIIILLTYILNICLSISYVLKTTIKHAQDNNSNNIQWKMMKNLPPKDNHCIQFLVDPFGDILSRHVHSYVHFSISLYFPLFHTNSSLHSILVCTLFFVVCFFFLS